MQDRFGGRSSAVPWGGEAPGTCGSAKLTLGPAEDLFLDFVLGTLTRAVSDTLLLPDIVTALLLGSKQDRFGRSSVVPWGKMSGSAKLTKSRGVKRLLLLPEILTALVLGSKFCGGNRVLPRGRSELLPILKSLGSNRDDPGLFVESAPC